MDLEKSIEIKSVPALLSVNFDELKASLEKEIEKYKIVVTADTVKDARKLATELNAVKKIIDDRRKEEVAKASKPVKEFDEQMKELVLIIVKGRQDVIDQVAVFDEKTKRDCERMLKELRQKLWDDYKVLPEFYSAEFDDLVIVSNVTDKGNLAKAAKDKLEIRVRDDKASQDRTERRLLQLENESLKAGLKATLEREHVKSFLYDDDDVYARELQTLIGIEIARQEKAEAALRADINKENERKAEEEKAKAAKLAEQPIVGSPDESRTLERQAPQESQQPPVATSNPSHGYRSAPSSTRRYQPQPTATRNGKVPYTIVCTFDLEVAEGISEEAIEAELRRVMTAAGITTLSSVQVQKRSAAA